MFGFRMRGEKKTPLAAAKEANTARKPHLAAWVAMTMTGMLAGIVLLSTQTMVPQVTRASGALVPNGSYQQIETMEGGIVQMVSVSDGQLVEAGQLLVQLENPDLSQQMRTTRNRIELLAEKTRNAQAIVDGLTATGADVSQDIERLEADGLGLAASRLRAFAVSQKAQFASIKQQSVIIAQMSEALEIAKLRAEKQGNAFKRVIDLHGRGLRTEFQYQQESDVVDELRGEAAEAAVRLSQARKALSDARAAIENERQTLLADTVRTLTDDNAELAEQTEIHAALHERIARLRLSAPARGVVQSVAFPNVGEVIEPGETLFELLPSRESLFAEVRIPGADIGHVVSSQSVELTVDTFDARRFGKVNGALVALSPVPLTDEQTGASYFRASIELDSATIGNGAYNRPLQAGMTVVAEMNTGEQNLMAYFMKPVQSSLERAFSER